MSLHQDWAIHTESSIKYHTDIHLDLLYCYSIESAFHLKNGLMTLWSDQEYHGEEEEEEEVVFFFSFFRAHRTNYVEKERKRAVPRRNIYLGPFVPSHTQSIQQRKLCDFLKSSKQERSHWGSKEHTSSLSFFRDSRRSSQAYLSRNPGVLSHQEDLSQLAAESPLCNGPGLRDRPQIIKSWQAIGSNLNF